MIFFGRLDLLRRKRGEALTDIASFLGISGPAIHSWKKGGLPKPDKLHLLAEHYGTTVEWLLSGKGTMSAEQAEARPPPCPHCAALNRRVEELEAKLNTAYETINNQSKALAQGRAIAAPAAGVRSGVTASKQAERRGA